jgi:calcium-dependent protein kinase
VKKPVDVKLLKKSNCTNEAIDLIQKLLEKEIDDRLSASEALEHSWFDKFELNNNECLSLTMDTIETLRDFSNKTTFQKEVLFFIAKITEEDEIKKLRQMFEEMDTANTGYLTMEEMKASFLTSTSLIPIYPRTMFVLKSVYSVGSLI